MILCFKLKRPRCFGKMTNILEIPRNEKYPDIRVNFYWLRDHCRCETCYDKGTSQRKFNFMDISLDICPKSHVLKDGQLSVVCKFLLQISVLKQCFCTKTVNCRARWSSIYIRPRFPPQLSISRPTSALSKIQRNSMESKNDPRI